MYKILIVDDDKLIVEDLKTLIDWEEIDCIEPQTATDGREALQKLKSEHFDIAITDISMPVMNGVELIRQVKENRINTVFLVISNYSDFTYVRDALKLGAVEYMLKYDITAESLKKQMVYAQEYYKRSVDLSFQQEQSQARRYLRGLYRNTRGIVSDIPTMCEHYSAFAVVLFQYRNNVDQQEITHILEREVAGTSLCSVYSQVNYQTGLVLLMNKNSSRLSLISIVEQWCMGALSILDRHSINATACISNVAFNIDELVKTIEPIKRKEALLFYQENGTYMHESHLKVSENTVFPYSKWRQYLFNEISIPIELKQDFKMRGVEEKNVKQFFASVMEVLAPQQDCGSDIWNALSAQELYSIVSNTLDQVRQHIPASTSVTRPEIRQALQYISRNYSKQISLAELSQETAMSSSYFCRVFKQEVGQNCSEYINGVRIQKAQTLLRTTTLRTNEIAEKVGFKDYRYFCRLFKELTGVTCGTYRKKGETL